MSLSQQEMRDRAEDFIEAFKNTKKENADTQTFWNEFFNIFGIRRRDVAVYERTVKKLDSENGGPPQRIDLFWPKTLLVEQKSANKKIEEADNQALDYYLKLPVELRPQFIISCNFHTFHLINLEPTKNQKPEYTFKLNELHEKLSLFEFMLGKKKQDYAYEEKVSTDASILMSRLYDELLKNKYPKNKIPQYLTRITYCCFAEDTGIFEREQFRNFVYKHGKDVNNLGPKLNELFYNLNKSNKDRQITLDEDIKNFKYINGRLFEDNLESASFNRKMIDYIIDCTGFNWSFISPAVFGNLFESVMNAKERRASGSHYTSEENILKVINPLFMDKLWDEFENIKKKYSNKILKSKMIEFQKKLSHLKFFDPACGSGSFLIIAYKCIRDLEFEIIKTIYPNRTLLDSTVLSKINVDQFYGIEKCSLPVHITESALWMIDHLKNIELMEKYDGEHIRIPLKKHPNIKEDDALEIDWNDILNSNECSYVFGNPPYHGSRHQSDEQRAQVQKIMKLKGKKKGKLDYVACWFIKASEYVKNKTPIGFVATNSITQGEQIPALWPYLLKEKIEIMFAHKQFVWTSQTKNRAKVVVIILGLMKKYDGRKRLFLETGIEKNPKFISFSLNECDVPDRIIKKSTTPLNGLPKVFKGSQIYDFSHYTFSDDKKNEFLKIEPDAKNIFKRFINSDYFINDKKYWILDLEDLSPNVFNKLPETMKLIQKVKQAREESDSSKTREFAETPKSFVARIIPETKFLAIPIVSSATYEYVPIGYLPGNIVPTNQLVIIEAAKIELFALLTSKMHMTWLNMIGGKLKKDYRYSPTLVYNTFPTPKTYLKLKPFGQKILDIRNDYDNSSLGDLYAQIKMPDKLKKAHKNLDCAVDKLYRKTAFKSDLERIGFLKQKYHEMIHSKI